MRLIGASSPLSIVRTTHWIEEAAPMVENVNIWCVPTGSLTACFSHLQAQRGGDWDEILLQILKVMLECLRPRSGLFVSCRRGPFSGWEDSIDHVQLKKRKRPVFNEKGTVYGVIWETLGFYQSTLDQHGPQFCGPQSRVGDLQWMCTGWCAFSFHYQHGAESPTVGKSPIWIERRDYRSHIYRGYTITILPFIVGFELNFRYLCYWKKPSSITLMSSNPEKGP